MSEADVNAAAPARPLRIAMVHYSDFAIDSRIQRQARALAERGHEVHCVCLTAPERIVVGDGVIRLYSIGARKLRGGVGDYLFGYSRFFISAFRRLSALQRLHCLDVVEAHNMPNFLAFAALVPKLRGARVVLDIHDTFPELFETKFAKTSRSAVARAIRAEERASVAFADRTIAVTEEARRRVAGRCPRGNVDWVVMNSPDERVFGAAREPVMIPPQGPVRVVYHGGTAQRFGVEALIGAFGPLARTAPEIRLDIYGAEDDSQALAALARETAPDHVRVAPRPVPFEEIPAKLEGAHIGVVPTLDDAFTELLLPVKLLEYVHLGIPVVTSRLPVIERYFSSAEVRFCAAGDADSIAEAIEDVRRHPEQAMDRARRASVRLQDIEWKGQRAAYIRRIEGLAAGRAVA
ncbi:MAG: glycosyltransferase [Actinomycetota bacterium]|nr:glycosyltransferase [Actinomycetota bacterium]